MKFTKLTGTAIPLPVENIDTDQILPARYLLLTTKDGYADLLFRDWRYEADGKTLKREFIFNEPKYSKAQILLAGNNFGIGSSREHAVWALSQYGIRVVISTGFGPIFQNNAYGNGLLVITVTKDILSKLIANTLKNEDCKITVDLERQRLISEWVDFKFEINPFIKEKIMKGLDNIGYILDKDKVISEYEKSDKYYFNKLKQS